MTTAAFQAEIAATLLQVAGVSIILVGVFLVGLERGTPATAAVRAVWAERMRGLAAGGWAASAGRPVAAVAAWLDSMIRVTLLRADRDGGVGALAMLGVLMVIPAAAVVNMLTGGSPFLATYYGCLLAAVAVSVATGEVRSLSWLRGIVSVSVLLSLFLVIPLYVLYAFTDFAGHPAPGSNLITALFVLPFWGLAALSVGYVLDQVLFRLRRRDGEDAVGLHHRFLAMAPVAFVCVHAAATMGYAVTGATRDDWPLHLVAVGVAVVTVTYGGGLWLLALASRCHRGAAVAQAVGLAAGLGVLGGWAVLALSGAADGTGAVAVMLGRAADGGVLLDWRFWLAHGAAAPGYLCVALAVVGLATRAMAAMVDGERRPYVAMGGGAAVLGLLVWLGGLAVAA